MIQKRMPRAPDERAGARGGVSCWQADTHLIAHLAVLGECSADPDIAGGA